MLMSQPEMLEACAIEPDLPLGISSLQLDGGDIEVEVYRDTQDLRIAMFADSSEDAEVELRMRGDRVVQSMAFGGNATAGEFAEIISKMVCLLLAKGAAWASDDSDDDLVVVIPVFPVVEPEVGHGVG